MNEKVSSSLLVKEDGNVPSSTSFVPLGVVVILFLFLREEGCDRADVEILRYNF